MRPLAESGGHSDERDAVYRRMVSWEDGVIVLEDPIVFVVGISDGPVGSWELFGGSYLFT